MDCPHRDPVVIDYSKENLVVAVLGISPDYDHEIGIYTERELEKCELDVLERYSAHSKHEAVQIFWQTSLRYGAKFSHTKYLPRTHEERQKLANNFIGKIKNLPHVASLQLVGSVARKTDGKFSDVDIVMKRGFCPGYENCLAAKLAKENIDLYCHEKT